ncbi:MAG: CHRD domain-containing protein [Chloroflexi bacterium]|nr:CHRD domain-containing protein [Chloroflexota bacterium]
MKRFAFAIAATIALAACGGAGTTTASPTTAGTTAATTAPTAAPTAAPVTVFTFKADLKSNEENPPITGAEATCAGTGTLTLDTAAKSAKFDVSITGCPASAVINIGHIHKGAKGVNGGVVIDSTLKAGDLKLTAGAVTFSKTNPAADPAVVADVIANPASYYMNFHSAVNGGGVIRAQLVKG